MIIVVFSKLVVTTLIQAFESLRKLNGLRVGVQ